MPGGHHRCHDQNISDFTDLRHLDIKGQEGETDPASVAVDGRDKPLDEVKIIEIEVSVL